MINKFSDSRDLPMHIPLRQGLQFVAKLGLFVLMVLSLAACKHQTTTIENVPLARVGDQFLYESDLKGLIPKNASARDSILICKSFVNKWIQTQLMVQQAEKNLPAEKLDFEKQLEEYRNSLISYQYESEYVKQHLDTVVTDSAMHQYYKQHLKDFELRENIVKMVYVVIDKNRDDSKKLARTFRKILLLPDSIMLDSLDKYAPTRVLAYSSDTNTWIPFNKVLKTIPIETYNQELYLKNHRNIRLIDENKVYLLKFVNFKIKDETSPIELEREFIRSIILNKRKTLLVKKLRKDIYQEAGKQKEYEIY